MRGLARWRASRVGSPQPAALVGRCARDDHARHRLRPRARAAVGDGRGDGRPHRRRSTSERPAPTARSRPWPPRASTRSRRPTSGEARRDRTRLHHRRAHESRAGHRGHRRRPARRSGARAGSGRRRVDPVVRAPVPRGRVARSPGRWHGSRTGARQRAGVARRCRRLRGRRAAVDAVARRPRGRGGTHAPVASRSARSRERPARRASSPVRAGVPGLPAQTPITTADLKLAIVHHTVSGNSYTAAQVPAVLRSVQAYHQDARGLQRHRLQLRRRSVRADLGGPRRRHHQRRRRRAQPGLQHRQPSVSWCSATSPTTVPTSAAVESVARVIAWKFALHRVDPASTVPFTSAGSAKYPAGAVVRLRRIVGHRDVQATGCPGSQLYSRLGTIRTRVAQLVPAYQQGSCRCGLETGPHRRRSGRPARVPTRRHAGRAVAVEPPRSASAARPRCPARTGRWWATSTTTASATCSGTAPARRPTASGGAPPAASCARPPGRRLVHARRR